MLLSLIDKKGCRVRQPFFVLDFKLPHQYFFSELRLP